MSRDKRIVTCRKKHEYLTVGKTYRIVNQDTFGKWVFSDSGYMIYVTNMYFKG